VWLISTPSVRACRRDVPALPRFTVIPLCSLSRRLPAWLYTYVNAKPQDARTDLDPRVSHAARTFVGASSRDIVFQINVVAVGGRPWRADLGTRIVVRTLLPWATRAPARRKAGSADVIKRSGGIFSWSTAVRR